MLRGCAELSALTALSITPTWTNQTSFPTSCPTLETPNLLRTDYEVLKVQFILDFGLTILPINYRGLRTGLPGSCVRRQPSSTGIIVVAKAKDFQFVNVREQECKYVLNVLHI